MFKMANTNKFAVKHYWKEELYSLFINKSHGKIEI